MSKTIGILALCATLVVPAMSFAQGTLPGAERGARQGERAAGPVGGVVGGAVGAATGTVGVGPRRGGCDSTTVHHEDAAGSETRTRTEC